MKPPLSTSECAAWLRGLLARGGTLRRHRKDDRDSYSLTGDTPEDFATLTANLDTVRKLATSPGTSFHFAAASASNDGELISTLQQTNRPVIRQRPEATPLAAMAYGELRANANAKQKPEVPTVKTNAAQKPSANSAAHFAVAETIRQAIAEEMALPEPDADKVLGHYELLDAQMLKAYSALKSEQAGQTPSSARARALRAMATAVTGKERDFLIAKAEECEARLAAMSDRAGLPAAPERYRDKPPPRSYDIALQRRKERGY